MQHSDAEYDDPQQLQEFDDQVGNHIHNTRVWTCYFI